MSDIVVVGAMMIDLMTYLPDIIPDFGGSTNVEKFLMGFGGKGANQAAMARMLESSVAFIGKLGEDIFGDNYRDNFTQLGINTSSISVSKTVKTGVAQIMVSERTGRNAITAYFGANSQLSVEDIRAAESLIAAAKCIVVSFEIPLEAGLEALRIAKRHKVTTLCNPAPTEIMHKLRQSAEFDEFLQLVDIICPNEYELSALTGESVATDSNEDTEFRNSVKQAIETLHKQINRVGNTNAVVMTTLGDRGAAFWNKETGEVEFVDACRVQAVDTTGAGDSFVGSLAYFVVRHPALAFREKIRRASQIATVSVLKSGTQCSYPKRADLPAELFQ